mgnify:CR=1 FL=1
MINLFGELILAGFFFFTPAQAEPVDDNRQQVIDDSVTCLALNMYYEARGQGTAELLAISYVVLNRVKDKRFPDTICEVIKQAPIRESWKKDGTYYPIRNRCQFSWYCDGKSDIPKNKKLYEKLLTLSKTITFKKTDSFIDITDGALFYHAHYVTPAWATVKYKTARIGDHIFYRWDWPIDRVHPVYNK